MNNYFDQFGRVHHKPVTESNPYPSGNPWIYSAFFKRVGGVFNENLLKACFALCSIGGKLIRNPDQVDSPISRDEILGMAELELLKPEHLNGWSFCPYEIPKFNAVKLVQQLYQLRPTLKPVVAGPVEPDQKGLFGIYFRHRNYYWRNNLDQAYRFEFVVPRSDRHFILKKWGKFKFYNPAHLFYAAFAKADKKFGKEDGISFLKYGTSAEKMAEEFPSDHPIKQKLGL